MTEKECVCFAVQTDYRVILYFRWLKFRAGEAFGNGRRGGCDVVHHSGGSQYTRDFSFTSVPLPTIFSKVANNFCHIWTSPNIVHEWYKFSQHRQTSLWQPVGLWGSMNWPNVWQNKSEIFLALQTASTEANVRKWETETLLTGLV
jgi:hypothetical protein